MTNQQIAYKLGISCIGVIDANTTLIIAKNMATAIRLTGSEFLAFTNQVLAVYF